jgi:hypothetical protein
MMKKKKFECYFIDILKYHVYFLSNIFIYSNINFIKMHLNKKYNNFFILLF